MSDFRATDSARLALFDMNTMMRGAAALFLVAAALGTGCNDSGDRQGAHDPSVASGPPADLGYDPNAFFLTDPPPKMCALDGTAFPQPEPPGGTPECPDDK